MFIEAQKGPKHKKGHVVMFIIFDFLHPVSSMLALNMTEFPPEKL